MGKKIDLYPGFRFYPTDEELITCYLKPKIHGQNLVCNIVSNTELYGPNSTPWQLFDVNDDDSWTNDPDRPSEKFLYVFTTLSKLRTSNSMKGTRRENTCKKAGCGTWVGKTSRKWIKDRKGNLIGEKRQLLFEINDTGLRFDLGKAGYFRMHEYSLCGVNEGLKSAAGIGDIVLCKITFDSAKEPIFKLSSRGTDHVSISCGEGQKTQNQEQYNKNPEGSVGDNLEGTSKSVMNIYVCDNIEGTECLTSENLSMMDSGVSDFDDCLAAADRFLQESNDFVGDPSFDMDWFIGLLTSEHEQEPVEDISKLGKRKYEEENMYVTKKMCLHNC